MGIGVGAKQGKEMTAYEYSRDQRNYFRSLIADWQRQNALKTTSESVKQTNLDRIKMLEYMISLQKQQ
ncbi:ABC transporter permease [Bacillus cereus group sp. BfR-BA-02730]|uniref:ABC transporter permease n=1 Tax=Bacillus cereus group sp. BfR-BA-02730 TaxID=3094893 RepID=UPI0029C42809|nr:ABC transporter permease [Bacillus cereus group sp. BfR-BA-02730]MDX5813385.1 ABC transporter permease [Bacillus cereus group sp. BfR-BA-02730]